LNIKANDSLALYFDIANDDALPLQKRIAVTEKALKIVNSQENDSVQRANLFKVANRYFNMSHWKNYKKTAEVLVEKSENANDSVSLAKAYNYIGDYYFRNQLADSSFLFYKRAEQIYLSQKNNHKLGQLYISFSRSYYIINDYGGSEFMAVKALKALKGTKDMVSVYEAYNLMGINANLMRQPEEALDYHKKALAVLEKNDLPSFLQFKALTYNNIGSVYMGMSEYEKASEYFWLSLSQKNHLLNNPESYARVLDNLAVTLFEKKDFTKLPGLFQESIKIKDSLNLTSGIVTSKNHLSEYYFHLKDTAEANKMAQEALILAYKSNTPDDLLHSLKRLAISDPKNANKYFEKYNTLKDSLFTEERKSRNRIARIEFQTDEIILEKDKAIAQKWMFFWCSVSGLLLAFLVFTISIQRSKKRELKLVKKQQYANEEIYRLILDQQIKFDEGRQKEKKRISKELHDGIMNKLASIRLNLFVLKKKTDPDTIAESLKYISEIQNIEKEIRSIAHDLAEDSLSIKDDYFALLSNLVTDFKQNESISLHLEIDKEINWDKVKAVVKMNCYRILQESINNIIKHANATAIAIEILKIDSTLEILIKDNGSGFDLNHAPAGIGLKNIKSRAIEISAEFIIDSEIGKGTSLKIRIPIL
jgi:signal transduction histidine kinase